MLEGIEPYVGPDVLTVYVGCLYRISYMGLCAVLEKSNFKISVDSQACNVALVDLSHLLPRIRRPPPCRPWPSSKVLTPRPRLSSRLEQRAKEVKGIRDYV